MVQALPKSMPGIVCKQPQGALVLGQFGSDAGIQHGDGGVGPVEGLDLHLQLEQRERVEGGGQGLGQRLQLGLHVGGQVGQDAARRASGDQPVEYAPPVDAEDVRQDAAEAQAVVVERFVDPVAGPATLGDQRPAVSGQLAQLAELTGRDIAGRARPN